MFQKVINHEFREAVPLRLVWTFLLFTIGIVILGTIFYKTQKKRIYSEQVRNLTAIATLKIGQIEGWYQNRNADASVIKDNNLLIRSIESFLYMNMPEQDCEALASWMKTIYDSYDYCGVLLLDSSFNVRLTIAESDSVAGDAVKDYLDEVKKIKKIVFTDLHRSVNQNFVHIDIIIPLVNYFSDDNNLIGFFILRIDPEKLLFPLIQSWPVTSKSAETLILRKNGDSLIYLNELRHRKNTVLKLSVSLSRTEILGVKAVNGSKGIHEGLDYRDVPVLGYLSSIPGLPWFMVTKIDKDEELAPLRRSFVITTLLTLLLIIINASVFGFWIWKQRVKLYKRQLMNEKEKRALENHFEYLIKYANDIIILSDKTGKIIEANDKALVTYGYTKEEILGMNAGNLISPAAGKNFTEKKSNNNDFGSVNYQTTNVRKNGSEFQVEISSRLIDVDGTEYIQIIARDITELIESEARNQESEKLFRNLFDNMLNGFAYCRIIFEDGLPKDFVYLNVNKAFETLTGLKDVEGEKVSEIIPGILEADPGLLKRYARVALTGNPEMFEIFVEALKMWFSISVYSPQREYFVAVFDVITQRKIAEAEIKKLNHDLEERVKKRTEQLEEANKELESFSYSVSHDLRAPLRAIHGYSNILVEEYENRLDKEGKRICGIISSSAIQMGELIDDLLSFSRIGRSGLNPSLIDMNVLVDSVISEFASGVIKKMPEFMLEGLINSFGDANLIRIVWVNLISNAIKYSSKVIAPVIIIGSEQEENRIKYFIKDNGVGFDMKYKNKLFGVFQRLHSENEFEGNGVGLAIVQRVINKHGGSVWAEGESEKGASFFFSLPGNSNLKEELM